ncbi:unnamed protein product [Coregonus sp. 'balchen']|nr:unnamed protein product [Coregonus sp. 'balchen']
MNTCPLRSDWPTVTPPWRLSYDEQLQLKQKHQKRILLQLSAQLLWGDSNQHKALTPSPSPPRRTSFSLLPILSSPVREGYRKTSLHFSVNRGMDGNPKMVGFYVATGKAGNIVCVNGDHLLNMPETQACGQVLPGLPPPHPWGPVCCSITEATGGRLDRIGQPFSTNFTGPTNSLYFQESSMTPCSHEESPYQLLHVKQGAHSLTCSVERGPLDKVIGIELIQQSVVDARHNAALNQIQNCEFLPGKAEVVLPGLMEVLGYSSDSSPLTTVVNPALPGPGLIIVNPSSIRRLLYISCKPEGEAMRNFRELCCRS